MYNKKPVSASLFNFEFKARYMTDASVKRQQSMVPLSAIQFAGWVLLILGVFIPLGCSLIAVVTAGSVNAESADLKPNLRDALGVVATLNLMINISASVMLLAEKMFKGERGQQSEPNEGVVWSLVRAPSLMMSFVVLTLWKYLGAYDEVLKLQNAEIVVTACAVMASSVHSGYRYVNVRRSMESPENVIYDAVGSMAMTIATLFAALTDLPGEVMIRVALLRLSRGSRAEAWKGQVNRLIEPLRSVLSEPTVMKLGTIYDLSRAGDVKGLVRKFLDDTVFFGRRVRAVSQENPWRIIFRQEEAIALGKYIDNYSRYNQ